MSKFWPSPIFLSSYCHTFPAHFFDGSTQGRWYSLQNIPIFSGIWVYSHMVISYNVTTLKRPASTKKVDFSKKKQVKQKNTETHNQKQTDQKKTRQEESQKKQNKNKTLIFLSFLCFYVVFVYKTLSFICAVGLLRLPPFSSSHGDHSSYWKLWWRQGILHDLRTPPAISHDIPMICLTWLNYSYRYSYRERERQI